MNETYPLRLSVKLPSAAVVREGEANPEIESTDRCPDLDPKIAVKHAESECDENGEGCVCEYIVKDRSSKTNCATSYFVKCRQGKISLTFL